MINMDAIKNIKIPIGVTLAVIASIFYAKAWADKEYVTQQEFQERGNEISAEISIVSEQIDMLTTTTVNHVEEFRISEATQAVREAKRDLMIAQISGASKKQLDAITEEIARATQYKQCLVRREPNCQHLLE